MAQAAEVTGINIADRVVTAGGAGRRRAEMAGQPGFPDVEGPRSWSPAKPAIRSCLCCAATVAKPRRLTATATTRRAGDAIAS